MDTRALVEQGVKCSRIILAGMFALAAPAPDLAVAQEAPAVTEADPEPVADNLSVPGERTVASGSWSRILTTVDALPEGAVYVAVGTHHGVASGDTLSISEDSTSQAIGALVVTLASHKRSVAEFVGTPFTVVQGRMLWASYRSRRPSAFAATSVPGKGDPPTSTQRTPTAPVSEAQEPSRRRPSARGRIVFEMDGRRSSTRYGEDLTGEVERWFVTPTMRLSARVIDLPGGLQFNTNVRLSYRHSTSDVVQPAFSTRVYQASVRKDFQNVPLELEAGRFYNRYDDFSGYFDGIMARVHAGPLGAGVALGLEPDRANEGLSSDLPKATAFVDVRARGGRAEYDASASFHVLRPGDEMSDRTFFGLTQDLGLGRVRILHRLQVDRDPESLEWTVTQNRLDGVVPLGARWRVRGGYGQRRPFSIYRTTDVISYERERWSGGISYWGTAATLGFDASVNRGEAEESSYTYSGYFSIPGRTLGGLGVGASFSYWHREEDRAIHVSPGLSYRFGRVHARAGYRYYRSDISDLKLATHGGNFTLDVPLTAGVHGTIRADSNWGEQLSSTRLSAALWMGF